jgi:hypothetical protein
MTKLTNILTSALLASSALTVAANASQDNAPYFGENKRQGAVAISYEVPNTSKPFLWFNKETKEFEVKTFTPEAFKEELLKGSDVRNLDAQKLIMDKRADIAKAVLADMSNLQAGVTNNLTELKKVYDAVDAVKVPGLTRFTSRDQADEVYNTALKDAMVKLGLMQEPAVKVAATVAEAVKVAPTTPIQEAEKVVEDAKVEQTAAKTLTAEEAALAEAQAKLDAAKAEAEAKRVADEAAAEAARLAKIEADRLAAEAFAAHLEELTNRNRDEFIALSRPFHEELLKTRLTGVKKVFKISKKTKEAQLKQAQKNELEGKSAVKLAEQGIAVLGTAQAPSKAYQDKLGTFNQQQQQANEVSMKPVELTVADKTKIATDLYKFSNKRSLALKARESSLAKKLSEQSYRSSEEKYGLRAQLRNVRAELAHLTANPAKPLSMKTKFVDLTDYQAAQIEAQIAASRAANYKMWTHVDAIVNGTAKFAAPVVAAPAPAETPANSPLVDANTAADKADESK